MIRHAWAAALSVALVGCGIEPVPLTNEQVFDQAQQDAAMIAAIQSEEPFDALGLGPDGRPVIDLPNALARALKYNLEARARVVEQALARETFELARMDMLPILTATGGYRWRDNQDASQSRSVITQQQSLEPSTSQDRDRTYYDLRLVWNVLDFGVSYYQAKQESDRFNIARLARRQSLQGLLQETRSAFWRAAISQVVEQRISQLLERSEAALADLRQIQAEQLRTPLVVLQDIRALTELTQQLRVMRDSVQAANVELARLIGAPLDADFMLLLPPNFDVLPEVPADLQTLERIALVNSIDYRTSMYNLRIDQAESRKSLLRLLPGLEFNASTNFDSNSFLFNNHWNAVGAEISWNIFRLLSAGNVIESNRVREDLGIMSRLAMHMAVITRFQLAYRNYLDVAGRLDSASELDRIDREIANLTRDAARSLAADDIARIQTDARALRSAMARLLALADGQAAYGDLLISLGTDIIPDGFEQMPLEELSLELALTLATIETGRFEDPLAELAETSVADAPAVEPGAQVATVSAPEPMPRPEAEANPIRILRPADMPQITHSVRHGIRFNPARTAAWARSVAQIQVEGREIAMQTFRADRPAETAAGDGRFMVQLGLFTDPAGIAAIRRQLTALGLPYSETPAEVQGRAASRFWIGPYRDRAQARTVAGQLDRAFDLSTQVLTARAE